MKLLELSDFISARLADDPFVSAPSPDIEGTFHAVPHGQLARTFEDKGVGRSLLCFIVC